MMISSRKTEYDTLGAEKAISDFLHFCKAANERYTGNIAEQQELENMTQDILHYAELTDNLDRKGANHVYKRLRDVRRKRRVIKNESELLEPVIQWMNANSPAVKLLERTLGDVRHKQSVIDNRLYTTKTDVMEVEKHDR